MKSSLVGSSASRTRQLRRTEGCDAPYPFPVSPTVASPNQVEGKGLPAKKRGGGLGDGWPLALDRGRMRIEDTVLYMFATQLGGNGEGAPAVAADEDGMAA